MARTWALAARCSLRGLGVALAIGLVIVGTTATAGAPTATGIGLIVAVTLVFFALHSAWRMAQGLQAFAQAIPADPHVEASATGRARLSWPSFGLVVHGRAALMREPELEAQAGGEPLTAPIDEGEGLAEEALQRLGVEP